MRGVKGRSRGFTLIASLLVLVLLSGIAISLLFMVQGAGQVGNSDLETNQAYYGAESGMELLTANLAALYQQSQSPTPAQLTALSNVTPTSAMINGMSYVQSITWTPDAAGNPEARTSVISPPSSNAGLTAEIIPLTLKVTATRPGGASVNMTRGVEVALIPVFQFGVFSDSDLSYFAGPNFDFQGRVHTNGNLFLAEGNGNSLVLDDKVTAVGEIIRDRLANNFLTNANYTGDVWVLNQKGGCDGTVATATNPALSPNCLKFTVPLASWSGGIPAAGVQTNVPTWTNTSTKVSPTTFGGWLGNNTSMAVQPLNLPFVQGANGAAQQIAIIRKAPLGELPNSSTGSSREYNKANIRILLASNPGDLHPEQPGALPEDIDLTAGGCGPGKPVAVKGVGGVALGTTRVAMAAVGQDPGWVAKPAGSPCGGPWNLIDGFLRVEYQNAAGAWVGITTEWLQLGFARGLTSPTKPVGGGVGSNPVHPNAILIFQQQADRDAICPGGICTADPPNNTIDIGANLSQYSWYPINLYDTREGFPRDAVPAGMANPACYVNGIMNAVELDVGNLRKWLQDTVPGGTGPLVSYSGQNGYLVYFSDRRGMRPDPNNGNITSGEYGFEDVINSASPTGTPDGVLEAAEDVDQNIAANPTPSVWGAVNVGDGFGVATVGNPYRAINSCATRGRQNIVTGARHVLKLVDGGLGNVPVRADNGQGGFTVASENPVYIQGNYNSDNTDPFWGNPPPAVVADINHSAAAVIADAVTLLSNSWSDTNSMLNPLNLGGRSATTPTYYRLAIAGGKNINFPQPAGAGQDFGTDGGVHNFLRYLEGWGGSGGLFYRGSLVSLYYSQYATGTFKCCTLVYGPPPRNYYFDSSFLDPAKLPPGTPMLQDVVNLTYWQDFKPY
jgi:type II secretory pathway pseudopilin PulG